jgi:hypothetical protein
MKNQTSLFLRVLFYFLLSFVAEAEIPSLINYQGTLMDAQGNEFNGTVSIALKVFDAESGGNQVYSETVGSVAVTTGLYSFQFGASGTSVRSATETIGEGNGSATTFTHTVNHFPIINPSVTISDGTYSWTESGSSNALFLGSASHTFGNVSAIYLGSAPASEVTITVNYQYEDTGIFGALAENNQSWAELIIDGAALTPRQRLITVPFAMVAQKAKTVEAGSITSTMLGASVNDLFNAQGITEFTSSGAWAVPNSVERIQVEMWGGGGGGGRSDNSQYSEGAGGGGSGGYVRAILSVTPGEVLTMTIGAGGAKATTDLGTGASGSNTQIISDTRGNLAIATGGTGGGMTANKDSLGGLGGTGTIIHGIGITRQGNPGDRYIWTNGSTPGGGIPGGSAIQGSIGKTSPSYSATRNFGSYGAGGKGGSRGNNYPSLAQDGIDGYIYIQW